jgi:hypothetical protein
LVDGLVQKAKVTNGSDNITVAVARIEKVPAAADQKEPVQMTVGRNRQKRCNLKIASSKKNIQRQNRRPLQHDHRQAPAVAFLHGLCGIMIAVLAYGVVNRPGLFQAQNKNKNNGELIASSEIPSAAGRIEKSNPAQPEPGALIGGYLVFLHVSDFQELQSLRLLPGVRVVDQFNPDAPSETSQGKLRRLIRPIFAGQYSFAIVDTLGSPVYRKDGLYLHTIAALPDTGSRLAKGADRQTVPASLNAPTDSRPDSLPLAADSAARSLKQDTSRVQQPSPNNEQ